MKQKYSYKIFIFVFLFILAVFTACGGKKKNQPQPKYYTDAVAQMNDGSYWYKKGCYERALEHTFKAHELFTLADYQDGVAKCFNNVGNIYRSKEDKESAVLFFNEAIKIYKNLSNYKGVVQTLSNKSAVYINSGDYKKAGKILNELESISTEKNYFYPPALNNRGILYIRMKEYSKAHDALSQAFSSIEEENYFEYAAVNYAFGTLMAETEKYKDAEEYYMKALVADRRSDFNKGIADGLFALGVLYKKSGRYNESCDYLQRSLKLYTLLQDNKNADKSNNLLKEVLKAYNVEKPDITITRHFIELWNNKNRLTSPCE